MASAAHTQGPRGSASKLVRQFRTIRAIMMMKSWSPLPREQRDKVLGFTFIFLIAVIWVISSFVVQEIVATGIPPFVLTYICNSMFVLYLPVVELGNFGMFALARTKEDSARPDRIPSPAVDSALPPSEEDACSADPSEGVSVLDAPLRPYNRYQTAIPALIICPIWFMAQYTFNESLKRTSVTSNTILSSLASLFTFLLSVVVLKESFTTQKFLGIGLCLLGTALVSMADTHSGHDTIGGDALCVLSACCYACYTVALKRFLPEDERVSTALFFGYVGLFNGVILAPAIIAMQLYGVFNLHALPVRGLALTLAKGLFDNVLSDYLWARAVLLVGPTIASVGLGIQIPMATAIELIIGHATWLRRAMGVACMLGGGFCVLVGFIAVSVDPVTKPDNQGYVPVQEDVQSPREPRA